MYEFEKLGIWQRSLDLIDEIYGIIKSIPRDDHLGLGGQIGRAALSISLNIAEGKGSGSDREFRRFLIMSRRSVFELVAALKVGLRLGMLKDSDCKCALDRCDEVGAKINKLISKLGAPGERQKANSK